MRNGFSCPRVIVVDQPHGGGGDIHTRLVGELVASLAGLGCVFRARGRGLFFHGGVHDP